MTRGLSLVAVGHATSLFLAVTFTLCVTFHLLFPPRATFQAWLELLPGFTWISWGSFAVGLLESYGLGWYLALIWVPLYNVFAARAPRDRRRSTRKAA